MRNISALFSDRSVAVRTRRIALATLLGWGSVLGAAQSAIAAETVILNLSSGELAVTIDELEAFATTGVRSPEIQDFFELNRQDEAALQRLLSEDVVIDAEVEDFLDTETGGFVLRQLDQLVRRSPNQPTLDALQTAVRASYEEDGRFSILEIVQAYPEPEIYLDLQGVETIYTSVKTFVEVIQPVLEAAKIYLEELNNELTREAEPELDNQPAEPQTDDATSSTSSRFNN